MKYLIESECGTYKATKTDKKIELFASSCESWNKPNSLFSSLESTGNGYEFTTDGQTLVLDYSELFELLLLARLMGEKADIDVYELKGI
jgi:hypothetical protein